MKKKLIHQPARPNKVAVTTTKNDHMRLSGPCFVNYIASLDEERQIIQRQSLPTPREVNIEKVNQAWLVRFLPVGLGSRNLWYVRLAQHRIYDQAITCPRYASPDFGGGPNAQCPVCELSDTLQAQLNEERSIFGFELRANFTYLTYCLVYQIDPGRGETEKMPEAEIIKPWRFRHATSSFLELIDYFLRGVNNARPYSFLDLERGNDFWATRTTKGIHLERQDPAPIFEKDANYEAKLDAIFNAITQPKIDIPTLGELEAFATNANAAGNGKMKFR
jgi:hypothetical protein